MGRVNPTPGRGFAARLGTSLAMLSAADALRIERGLGRYYGITVA